MSGYSRIKKSAANRSKSADFSEFSLTRSTPTNSEFIKSQQITAEHQHDGAGEVFGEILGRKYCGGASARNFAAEKESAAVKRSFSVKRSASVSDGYSRIHHQPAECGIESIFHRHGSCVKKKGKFFRAFRRLFGL